MSIIVFSFKVRLVENIQSYIGKNKGQYKKDLTLINIKSLRDNDGENSGKENFPGVKRTS